MTTKRVGPTGVLSATGNMIYRDASGNIDEVDTASASNGQVLTRVAGLPAWADPSIASRVGVTFDPNDAIFFAWQALAEAEASQRDDFPMIAYDPDTDEAAVWEIWIPQDYDAAKDLALNIYWTSTAIVGDAVLNAQFERNEAGHNITAQAPAAIQTVTDTAPGTDGDIVVTSIPFTNAQADAVAAGDRARVAIIRDADNVADTLLTDLQFLGATLIEAA